MSEVPEPNPARWGRLRLQAEKARIYAAPTPAPELKFVIFSPEQVIFFNLYWIIFVL